MEIGCGGGDNLKAIRNWAERIHLPVLLKGVDINPECIAYAKQQKRNRGIEFIISDYKNVLPEQKPDIIFSSLFCHHFDEDELVSMLQWMKQNSRIGFFINDLHRHWLAFYSIKILTQLFSKSYLVKNDAPLSVCRGLKRREWNAIFAQAGISDFNCKWRWAFRWLITSANATE
jgi:2-polyprenyl-3-methyl-5-hydroxy-6-metoxy-1,4-benzoquinol methylase